MAPNPAPVIIPAGPANILTSEPNGPCSVFSLTAAFFVPYPLVPEDITV